MRAGLWVQILVCLVLITVGVMGWVQNETSDAIPEVRDVEGDQLRSSRCAPAARRLRATR